MLEVLVSEHWDVGSIGIGALGCWKYWYQSIGMMGVLVAEHWDDGGIGIGALG